MSIVGMPALAKGFRGVVRLVGRRTLRFWNR